MKNKKLLGILGITALLLAGNFAFKEANEVDAAGEVTAVQKLFEKYYNNGVYTKDTKINVKDSTKEEIRAYFHAGVSALERTTYYDDDELWMTNDEDTINSGYGTSEEGMTHFSKDANGNNVVDYVVQGTTMEEYYVTLNDFVGDAGAGWVVEGKGYSTTNSSVLNNYRLFTAPLWVGENSDNSNYILFDKATVVEEDGKLIMSLYAKPVDSGKLSNANNLFSQAVIYRGVYSVNIGSKNYRIDINDNSTNEWALAEYMLLGKSVKANDTFELVRYGKEILPINNYEGNLSDGAFTKDNESSDLYIKFYDGAIDVYASEVNVAVEDELTIYFTNNWKWSKVNCYYWGGTSVNWPGTAMTYSHKNSSNEDVYKITLPEGTTHLIFNNGSQQTVDISLVNLGDNNAYYLSGWNNGKINVGTWKYTA